jgi:hypothetical protein
MSDQALDKPNALSIFKKFRTSGQKPRQVFITKVFNSKFIHIKLLEKNTKQT